MVAEVKTQVEKVHRFVTLPESELFDKIKSKESYINNLKTVIENDCYGRIHEVHELDRKELSLIRAIMVITANLERIADACVNVIRQMEHLKDAQTLRQNEYEPMFDAILESLDKILPALGQNGLSKALQICRAEFVLDSLYSSSFQRQSKLLLKAKPDGICNHLTAIFIYHYLERIGDLLLNIGEQLLFATLGQSIKIEQFDSLQQTLKSSGYAKNFDEICFQAIWGSRSGCRIGKVELAGGEKSLEHGSIYKEGERHKIAKEKESLEIWNQLFPGLAPKVYGYIEDENRASLLVEFLKGQPLNELIFTKEPLAVEAVLKKLESTLQVIWENTTRMEPFETNYMQQLQARKEDVLKVHPYMKRSSLEIGNTNILSTDELIEACTEIEKKLPAPFSVRIHGDFNTNNILYDVQNDCIHYIDLYRSKQSDYVQDVSVFLASNFRVPAFEPEISEKLNLAIAHCYKWVLNYAEAKNDKTVQARMALALARSFFTSARFETLESFAKEMFMRSIFLLESINEHHIKGKSWEEFILPEEILYY